ncbi:hypothetical protein ACE6H2_016401 [Prunus campanulata]
MYIHATWSSNVILTFVSVFPCYFYILINPYFPHEFRENPQFDNREMTQVRISMLQHHLYATKICFVKALKRFTRAPTSLHLLFNKAS